MGALVVLGAPCAMRAQAVVATDTAPRSAPANRLAGRARVGLDASAGRMDKGTLSTYSLGASVAPFLGEHLQVGIAPSVTLFDPRGGSNYHALGSSLIANYVFGGDARWRGYVGAFGAASSASYSVHTSEIGAQAGALFFITPAVAVRGELRYRDFMEPASSRIHVTVLYIGLDPYLFGGADAAPIVAAGFGTADVTGYYFYQRVSRVGESGISGTIAPYLTRWAQIGATGEADGTSQEIRAHQLRGFGRVYLPVTVRTQPFAEGFAETTTFNGENGGLTSYGGEVGMRRMLNANVALDVGLRRTMHPRETLGSGNFTHPYREPGGTALVVGMMTRIGRAH